MKSGSHTPYTALVLNDMVPEKTSLPALHEALGALRTETISEVRKNAEKVQHLAQEIETTQKRRGDVDRIVLSVTKDLPDLQNALYARHLETISEVQKSSEHIQHLAQEIETIQGEQTRTERRLQRLMVGAVPAMLMLAALLGLEIWRLIDAGG